MMPFKELLVCVLSVKMLTLWLSLLLFSVSLSEADHTFSIRFFEFRNPLGLQCGECGNANGGPPACCDDVQRLENCNTTRPFNCDTRFRFSLRPFGALVETAPNTGFPHFTPSNSLTNSFTFNEGPSGLLALPNPFTITRIETWTGRIQFFIDALDNDVASGISETEVIINRFPIDLELNPGPDFTERTTYTGFYNISGVGFDMSFRVQCLENYFGPNCTTFCEPLEGVYTCDSEGRSVCLQDNRDPTTNCVKCLQGWDLETNCTTCSIYYNNQSDCIQCVAGRNITTNCTTCLTGYDPSTNCTQCLPGVQCQANQQPTQSPTTTQTPTATSPTQAETSINLALVGGAVGGAAGLLFLILLLLCIVIIAMVLQLKKQRKMTFPGAVVNVDNPAFARDLSMKERTETARLGEHDFDNPLYDEAKQENNMDSDISDYSKLQHPPLKKSFMPPQFPYIMEHNEETSYQLDVAGKSTSSGTNNGHPGYDIAYPPPLNDSGGAYDVTHHPHPHAPQPSPSAIAGGIYNLANFQGEEQAVYDVANQPPEEPTRLSQNDYADIVDIPGSVPRHYYDYADIADTPVLSTSAPQYDYADTVVPLSSLPNPTAFPLPHEHEYAVTEDVMMPRLSESTPSTAAYTNTTPGQVTPEALNHYDFGQ